MSERKLWAAVMLEAIDCLNGSIVGYPRSERNNTRRDMILNDTTNWFRSNSNGIGSFCWICDILDMDPDIVRRSVLNWKFSPGSKEKLRVLYVENAVQRR